MGPLPAFDDKTWNGRDAEFAYVFVMIVLTLMLASTFLAAYADAELYVENTTVDLSPPEIAGVSVYPNKSEAKLFFSYVASDVGHGGSDIWDTGVYLFRTPRSSDRNIIDVLSVNEMDDRSGRGYTIEILLKDIDSTTHIDDNGLVDITQATGVKVNPVDGELDESIEEVSGYADFSGVEVYDDCKYYLVIVVVDYWGNARWEIYDVSDDVHKLSNPSRQSPHALDASPSPPRIASLNIPGTIEPNSTFISHYYTLGKHSYIPWMKTTPGELQRCFSLVISPRSHNVSIRELNTSVDPSALSAGIFVLRCYDLWGCGSLTVLVDGERFMEISFRLFLGEYSICILAVLVVLLVVLGYIYVARRRGKS